MYIQERFSSYIANNSWCQKSKGNFSDTPLCWFCLPPWIKANRLMNLINSIEWHLINYLWEIGAISWLQATWNFKILLYRSPIYYALAPTWRCPPLYQHPASTCLSRPVAPRDRTLDLSPHSTRFQTAQTNYVRGIFPVRLPTKTGFTTNANQSNESVTRAHVASTEICACHRGKKLIFNTVEIYFTTVEIDFYHRGKIDFYHRGN